MITYANLLITLINTNDIIIATKWIKKFTGNIKEIIPLKANMKIYLLYACGYRARYIPISPDAIVDDPPVPEKDAIIPERGTVAARISSMTA